MGGVFLSSILAATVLTLFSACDSPSSSWEEPVRDYFDKYTNTAAIEKQEISFQTQKDNSGTTCIPSDGNKTITFYLRNPRLYTLETSFSEPDTYPDIQIVQDTQDKTIIRLTYSQDYLLAHEGGQQIGGTIHLTESETLREFDPYSFSLKCNTPPPGVKGATVQKDDSNKHVVCFYLPTDQLSSPRHQNEAHTLYIGKTAISLGTQASLLSSANTTRPSPLYPAKDGGPSFSTTPPAGYTPFYYTTSHGVADGDTSWKIKIVDENGFSSYEATASTATTAQPLTLSGDSTVVKGQTINITAALPVGVTATSYEVESSTDAIVNATAQANGTIQVSASNAGTTTLTVTANLPGGQISQATKTIRVIDLTLSDASEEVMFVDGDDVNLSATPAGFPSTPTCTWSTSNASIATVNSSGKVSATGVGTATITASATYDGKTVNATKTVQVCSASISGENMSLVGSSNTFVLTATVSKPDSLTQSPSYEWSSSTGTVASATRDATDHSKATVTPSTTTSGTTDIKVKVTIDSKDFTAKKTVTIYDLKINGNPLIDASVTTGTTLTAKALVGTSETSLPTGMNISWNKGSSPNANLSTSTGASCTLTPNSAGSFDLQVNASLSNGKSLTKTKKIYVIGVSGDKNFIEGETPRALSVTPATGLTYTWQPLNASIADVNTSNGKITAKSGGDASIKLTASLGSDSKTITIPISVYGITISGNPLLKKGGSNTTLTASVKKGSTNYPETLTYEWTSGSTNKATAGKTTGVISPVAAGTSEITLAVKRSGTTVATKKQKVYVIEVSGLTTFVAGEEERKLSETPLKSQATELTYTWGSNSSNAEINSSTGYIKAKAKGSATITLTVTKGSYSLSVPTTIDISKITLTGLPTEIAVGEEYECSYSFDPDCSFTAGKTPSSSTKVDCSFGSPNTKLFFEGLATGTETFTLKLSKDGTTIQYKLPTITVVAAHEVSISDLNEWLSNQPETTVSKPYKLKVTGMTNSSHLTTLANALKATNNPNKYVDLSATTLPSVESLQQCFVGCSLMVYPPVIPSGVKNMKNCFGTCLSLKKAPEIPSGVTDMTGCFVSCYSLETPPATIPSTVKSMEACFYYCSNLKTPPVISNGVENLFYCFEYCSKLESAPEIPASVTNMARCFRYCTLLSGNVTIKANITDKLNWINTFTDCSNIGTVYVKSSTVKNSMKHNAEYDVGISADKIQVSS